MYWRGMEGREEDRGPEPHEKEREGGLLALHRQCPTAVPHCIGAVGHPRVRASKAARTVCTVQNSADGRRAPSERDFPWATPVCTERVFSVYSMHVQTYRSRLCQTDQLWGNVIRRQLCQTVQYKCTVHTLPFETFHGAI